MVLGSKQDEAWQDTLSKFLMKLIKIGSLRYQFPNRIFLGLQTHTLFKHYLNGKKEVNATWEITWESRQVRSDHLEITGRGSIEWKCTPQIPRGKLWLGWRHSTHRFSHPSVPTQIWWRWYCERDEGPWILKRCLYIEVIKTNWMSIK